MSVKGRGRSSFRDDFSLSSSVKSKFDVRDEIRDYIRNERDTVLKKWMALKESVKSEDHLREKFYDRRRMIENKQIPINILKFIGSLKKAVRNIMRDKGGTPYSIIRSMFIYWDGDKNGAINAKELLSCMHSLSVQISLQECQEIVSYYTSNGQDMDYSELLKDIQLGEPTIIEFVSKKEEDEKNSQAPRFQEVSEMFNNKPPIVQKFLEAVRVYVTKKMQAVGGTPQQHIKFLFQFFDYDYSGGLQAKEIEYACRRKMNLVITDEQAIEIVKFYDRKFTGEMDPDSFTSDVCADVKSILTFVDVTPEERMAANQSLKFNPFVPKPFHAPANKILEKFKKDVKLALVMKVNKIGGSVSSWVREAFVTWDPHYSRKIKDPASLLGAAKRLGVDISESDARVLMKCYDRFNNGEMHYMYLAKEITEEDPHFLSYYTINSEINKTATTRTPAEVNQCLDQLKRSIEGFVRQSKGKLQPRSIIHGTCLRFDPSRCGHIDIAAFKTVLKELKTSISDGNLRNTLDWFDTTGNNLLDYNSLTRQMYGADAAITEKLILPSINENTTAKQSQIFMRTGGKNKSTSDLFGVDSTVKELNLAQIENPSVARARYNMNRNKIIAEKAAIQRKIADIDTQRKGIIDDIKKRRKDKLGKTM